MNIAIDTQFSTSSTAGVEAGTTTYKAAVSSQGTGNVSGSSFLLDIADKVMDNEAYRGHGLTADEIMQQAANTNAHAQKDFMIVMSSCVSGEDLQRMQEEGFNPASTDVETYVTIVDKIKVTLAQAGVEIAGYTDDLDVEKVEQITGSRTDANALVKELSQSLAESDIPVTNENIAELAKAVVEALQINGLSDDTIKYLVVNQKQPTIENVYRAQYSSADTIRQSQGYYSEGAGSYGKYYAKKAENIDWDKLQSRLEETVAQAGLDTDEDTKAQAMENAKWLVASGIELNADNLNMVTKLKNLTFPMKEQDIAKQCVTAMENGKSPVKADLTGEKSIVQEAQEILEEVESISDEAVHEVAASGEKINIKNLSEAQKQIDAQNEENANRTYTITDEAPLKEVQAKRQLEEIRLMMSEEANRHLLKAGISIDTTELGKLVDALKVAEENIRAALFQGESAVENEQRALLYEETLAKTGELVNMPAAILGKLASGSQGYTLLRIHEEGKALQKELDIQHEGNNHNPNQSRQERASSAYETLMTAPRKDLGDRISKAFRNVDDILTDMKLETSEANRRAVRILGYNSMEISEENINAVKEADSKVTGVISKMTPATTLQMIREQKNPLEMTMDELDAYLNEKGMEPSEDAEKYAKFLQRLDRSNGISENEREAYIGIYRMFRQIEKSDGAVIGSIVATGAEMNFKNMLSAVRTASDKNMDVRVDDGFGALENLITKGKAIDSQINAGYQGSTGNDTEQDRELEKYYARLSGEINQELSDRTDLSKLKDTDISEKTTIEEFADNIKMTQMSENDPIIAEEKVENFKSFRQNMQEVEQVDEQIIESLIDYGQTISVDNIQAASMLLFDRGSLFKQIIGETDGDGEEPDEPVSDQDAENAVLEKADSFVEHLQDAKQAKVSYQEMISEANKAVESMIYAKGTLHIDVKAAQALYKGLSLAGNLAREENYEVPMNIDGEITSVNLKIYHNASQTGKVAVTLDTEALGRVAAEFDVTNNRISGMVVYENAAAKETLELLEKQVSNALSTEGDRQVTVSLVHTKSVDLGRFGQDRSTGDEKEAVSTRTLYQTAKAFLTALKGV